MRSVGVCGDGDLRKEGEVMTLLERIKSADVSELATFLCKMYERSGSCGWCPAEGMCYLGHNGMTDFLKQECREDVEISYLVE